MSSLSRYRSRIELAGLIVGLLLMALVLNYAISSDGMVRYRMLQALVEEGRLTPDAYSLVHCLAALPLYALGKLVGRPEILTERFNFLVFSGMLLVLYKRLAPRSDPALIRQWFLLLLVGSMFLHHLRNFFTEVFSTACVVIGLTCLVTEAPLIGALALCIGVINAPAWIVPLTLISLKLAWDRRQKGFLLLPVVSLAGILLEAWIRRGSPFNTGYGQSVGFATILPYSGLPNFSYPLLLGVLSLLFSFGKGLLFFTPGLVLAGMKTESGPLPSPLRQLQALCLLFVAGLVLVYAKWWSWYGGWFWGPRFLLLACVPASLALAQHLQDAKSGLGKNLLTLGILLLSVWVGIDGATWGLEGLEFGAANRYALESMTWYVPEFSPLWYPLVRHRPLLRREMVVVLYCVAVAIWLALPLLARLSVQLRERLGALYEEAVGNRQ